MADKKITALTDLSTSVAGEDLLHEASVYTLGAKYKVTKKMHVNLNYDIVDAEKSDSSGFDLNGDTLKVGVSYNY